MPDAQALRQRMVEGLDQRGELDERWRAAFTAVPRHEFLPELVWRQDHDCASDCDLVPLRRAEDPQRWLELAYANASVSTQVDDGHPAGADGCGFEVTSSASMPAVVAQMLAALEVEPGMHAAADTRPRTSTTNAEASRTLPPITPLCRVRRCADGGSPHHRATRHRTQRRRGD
ncbi:MAG: hypothetical protein ACRDSZ_08035, partial [Pseudonocardiaceae bacterium]